MNTKWYTPEEIAASLKINKLTVYKYINNGSLKAIKLGRHYRISEENIESFIAKKQIKKGGLKDVLSAQDYLAVSEAKSRLLMKYKDKIKIIKVFGSKARGDANEESDLDLLIIVNSLTEALEKEIRRTVYGVNDQFDYTPFITNVIISQDDFVRLKKLGDPFLQNVQEEGIDVWKAA